MTAPATTEIEIDWHSDVSIECDVTDLINKTIQDGEADFRCVVGCNYETEQVKGYLIAEYKDGKVFIKLDYYEKFSSDVDLDELIILSIELEVAEA